MIKNMVDYKSKYLNLRNNLQNLEGGGKHFFKDFLVYLKIKTVTTWKKNIKKIVYYGIKNVMNLREKSCEF